MPPNTFSDFTTPGGVKIKGVTKPFRRVGHSARDWGRSKKPVSSVKHDKANTAHAVVDTAGTVTGIVAIGTSIAILAGSTAAFAVAVGGPQVAITLGVIALVGIAKGAYSNRDNAHRSLQPYVYTLLDDVAPVQNIYGGGNSAALKEAGKAALYLMKEAGSQYDQMGHKLKNAQASFNKFWDKYQKERAVLTASESGIWVGQKMMTAWSASPLPPSQRGSIDFEMLKVLEIFNDAKIKSDKTWVKGCKQGNPVFEFMRRLVHVGNYLQSAGIIEQATYVSVAGVGIDDPGDALARWQGARDYRQSCKDMSDLIALGDANYLAFEQFVTTHNIANR